MLDLLFLIQTDEIKQFRLTWHFTDCVYNNVTYKNGEKFQDKCNNCTCDDGKVTCTNETCGKLRTPVNEHL